MTVFSDLFTEILEKKNITIYSLAQTSGVERSYLQKMKKGERLPKDEEKILNIAEAMHLSQSETIQFLDAFSITQVGENIFLNRKKILKIINSFQDIGNSNLCFNSSIPTQIDKASIPLCINGKTNIQNLIKILLESTVSKGNSKIKIISNPSFPFLYDYISTLDLDRNNIIIENIVSMAAPSYPGNPTFYNLEILEKLIPLLFNSPNFHCYYLYDSLPSVKTDYQFLPVKIIFDDLCFAISHDSQHAIVSSDVHLQALFEEYFSYIFKNVVPIFSTVIAEPNNYLENILSFMNFDAKNNYNVMYQPCILPFIPKEIFLDVLNFNQLKPEIFSQLSTYMDIFANYNGKMYMTVTMKGIEEYFRNGYLLEVPAFLISHTPTMIQRLKVFKNLITAFKEDLISISIARDYELKISPNLLVTAYSDKDVVIHYIDPKGKSMFLRLEEIGLSQAFYDFLTTVHKSNLVKNKEESLQLLEAIYEKYAK